MTDGREVRATAVGATLLFFYVLAVLLSGRVDLVQFAGMYVTYLAGSFTLVAALGVVCAIVHAIHSAVKSGKEPFLAGLVRDALLARWQRDRGLSLLWPPVMFATLMATFNAFKQMILPLAGFGFDPWLAEADRWLFLGQDGWRVTHSLFGSAGATLALDRLYHGWFFPMAIGVGLCAWLPASTYWLRTQYLLSYLLVWIGIGSLLAILTPSAGPCFYPQLVGPEPSFESLMDRLGGIRGDDGATLNALRMQALLLDAYGSNSLMVGRGISAMPSVHNALAALFAIATWQFSRPLSCLFGAYALAIWIGSIHLGWHYGLDGIVAVALTVGIWRGCGWVAQRLEKPIMPEFGKPALA